MPAADDLSIDPQMLESLAAKAAEADLEPLAPEKALEMYASVREDEVSDSTMRSHQSRLGFFRQWCDENAIDDMNDLNGRDLQEFRKWRKTELSVSTLETNMRTLRIFLRKCVKFDAVPASLPDKVDIPSVDEEDNTRDEIVSGEQAKEILSYLDQYHFASIEHVVWLLLAAAGLRLSAVRALDVGDYDSTSTGGTLELRHRPDSGTSLKNKEDSERPIDLDEYVSEVLDKYLANQRPETNDEYGRSPLIASEHGRLSESTIRKYVYKWTRPCVISGDCPHERNPEECEAAQTANNAYQCPSSSSPHPVRRGYITHELDSGVPKAIVSFDCDVSEEIIEQHYDKRSNQDKLELSREIRESVYQEEDTDEYYK